MRLTGIAAAPVRAAWLAAGAGMAAAVPVLYRYNPLQVHFYPRCPLYVMTGIYCPGCGALRAGHALLHGHVLTALDYNVLFVAALPFLAYALLAQGVQAVTGRRLPVYRLSGGETKAILWALLLFMLLRNLPVYPLSVLAP
ncbi:MAG TPA: DUF2752 domain-containing protein [Longimicrobiaceae bacterium]|nr:DUF2752 domain-containing protein [Longimicrobiaceae bacterium]